MHIIHAEVTGTVWKIEAAAGAAVVEGDTVVIVESMKMEIPVTADRAGTVRELLVAEGDLVADGQAIAVIDG